MVRTLKKVCILFGCAQCNNNVPAPHRMFYKFVSPSDRREWDAFGDLETSPIRLKPHSILGC